MQDHPVEILLHSRQQMDGESQVIRQQLQGTLKKTEDGFLLTYAEEDQGLGHGKTIFRFSPGLAVMSRCGGADAQMRFSPGQRHSFVYPTPYGKIPLTVETEKLLHNLTEQGGSVMLRYRLCQGEGTLGLYTIKLHIKEKDGSI